jgi:hypothetical protein
MVTQLKKQKVCLFFCDGREWADNYFFLNYATYKNCYEHSLQIVNKK